MSILSGSITSELAAWNLTESPLVTASRSFRNEGSSTSSSGTGDGGNDDPGNTNGPVNPLSEIDLDSLPAEVRDVIANATGQFTILQTNAAKVAQERDHALQLSRQHQSRADQVTAKLKQHNLLDDGNTPRQPQGNPMEETLVQRYMTDMGMDKATATQWAKVMMVSIPVMEESTANRVAHSITPLVQTVGNMAADRALSDFTASDQNGLMSIPEIHASVTSGVKALVSQGQGVDTNIVQNLVNMAYGELAIQKPEVLAAYQNNPQPNPQPVLHNIVQPNLRITGRPTAPGAMRPTFGSQYQGPGNGAPVARDPETARAVAATVGHMLRGTNIKPKP